MDTEEHSDSSLLVIILDLSPTQNILRIQPSNFASCVEAVISFANAHIMQRAENSVAVIATLNKRTSFIFPAREQKAIVDRSKDGQYEMFSSIESIMKENLADLIKSNEPGNSKAEALMAGSMGKLTVLKQLLPSSYLHKIIHFSYGSLLYFQSS